MLNDADIALRRLTSEPDSDFPWTNLTAGADLADQLSELTGGLSAPGTGKRIESGFSYWGVESTVAWGEAVADRFYPVMRESLDSFARRWRTVARTALGQDLHYVSLGPGTGEKDFVVLSDMLREKPDIAFVPVDMSPEMMRFLVHQPFRALPLNPVRLMPLQLDFSEEANVRQLRKRLDWVLPDQGFLFSLLGNTLANFDEDAELLRMLCSNLLRPNDRLLLEVATTSSVTKADIARAADEYRRSRRFREFVTCSLQHYTDLTVDLNGPGLEFNGAAEEGHGIAITMLYRNATGEAVQITLPDRSTVMFPPEDSIRLYLTRKYLPDGVATLLKTAELKIEARQHVDFTGPGTRHGQFGMDLILLSRPETRQKQAPEQALAASHNRR